MELTKKEQDQIFSARKSTPLRDLSDEQIKGECFKFLQRVYLDLGYTSKIADKQYFELTLASFMTDLKDKYDRIGIREVGLALFWGATDPSLNEKAICRSVLNGYLKSYMSKRMYVQDPGHKQLPEKAVNVTFIKLRFIAGLRKEYNDFLVSGVLPRYDGGLVKINTLYHMGLVPEHLQDWRQFEDDAKGMIKEANIGRIPTREIIRAMGNQDAVAVRCKLICLWKTFEYMRDNNLGITKDRVKDHLDKMKIKAFIHTEQVK